MSKSHSGWISPDRVSRNGCSGSGTVSEHSGFEFWLPQPVNGNGRADRIHQIRDCPAFTGSFGPLTGTKKRNEPILCAEVLFVLPLIITRSSKPTEHHFSLSAIPGTPQGPTGFAGTTMIRSVRSDLMPVSRIILATGRLKATTQS